LHAILEFEEAIFSTYGEHLLRARGIQFKKTAKVAKRAPPDLRKSKSCRMVRRIDS
jgi:hypothetical protein